MLKRMLEDEDAIGMCCFIPSMCCLIEGVGSSLCGTGCSICIGCCNTVCKSSMGFLVGATGLLTMGTEVSKQLIAELTTGK